MKLSLALVMVGMALSGCVSRGQYQRDQESNEFLYKQLHGFTKQDYQRIISLENRLESLEAKAAQKAPCVDAGVVKKEEFDFGNLLDEDLNEFRIRATIKGLEDLSSDPSTSEKVRVRANFLIGQLRTRLQNLYFDMKPAVVTSSPTWTHCLKYDNCKHGHPVWDIYHICFQPCRVELVGYEDHSVSWRKP